MAPALQAQQPHHLPQLELQTQAQVPQQRLAQRVSLQFQHLQLALQAQPIIGPLVMALKEVLYQQRLDRSTLGRAKATIGADMKMLMRH